MRTKLNPTILLILLITVDFFYRSEIKAGTSSSSQLAFTQNARTLENNYSSLVEKGLANSCLSIIDAPDSLPCNPATIPLNYKSDLGAEALISNGYQAIKNTQLLLGGNLSQEVVDTLFQQNSELQIEGNADVHFRSPYLTGRYVPITIKGFTIVRNEANPDVEIQALQESGFTFQTGKKIYGNLYAGIQTRLLNRTYINQKFKLVDLGTEDGKEILNPKKQTLTYIEPGFYLPFEHSVWSPRISLLVANLGFVNPFDKDLNQRPEPQLGLGFTPPVRWGRLDFSVDYKSLTIYDKSILDRLHLGILYHFGSLYLANGIDHNGASSGVFYSIEKINAGILYSTTKTTTSEENYYTQTVYVQMGWQI